MLNKQIIITKLGFFVTFILYGSNKEYYTNSKRDEMHLFFARKTFCSTCLSTAFLSAPVHQKLPKSAIPQANFCFLSKLIFLKLNQDQPQVNVQMRFVFCYNSILFHLSIRRISVGTRPPKTAQKCHPAG